MGIFRAIKLHFTVNRQIKKLTHQQKQDLVLNWMDEQVSKKTKLPYPEWLRKHIASTIHKK